MEFIKFVWDVINENPKGIGLVFIYKQGFASNQNHGDGLISATKGKLGSPPMKLGIKPKTKKVGKSELNRPFAPQKRYEFV